MAALVCFLAGVVLAVTPRLVEKEVGGRQVYFYCGALLWVSALLGITMAADFFNFFVFLEVAALSAYALVGMGAHPLAPVAAFRYLLLGTVGASLYLLGVGCLYGATGTLNMQDWIARFHGSPYPALLSAGIVLILGGLALKIGLFPLHGWMPDAYAYAPSASAALLAPLMTQVMLYGFLRLVWWIFLEAKGGIFEEFLLGILRLLSAAAIVAGAFWAFLQTDLRRMLAYSSVSQIGYILLGVTLGNSTALLGALLHILNQAIMKTCFFLFAAQAEGVFGVRRVTDLGSLHCATPWGVRAFWIASLSMIGIPPACGFFSKWYLLLGAWEAQKPFFAAVIVGASLLTAAYFFKVLEQISFSSEKAKILGEGDRRLLRPLSWGVVLTAFLILLLGPLSSPLVSHVLIHALP